MALIYSYIHHGQLVYKYTVMTCTFVWPWSDHFFCFFPQNNNTMECTSASCSCSYQEQIILSVNDTICCCPTSGRNDTITLSLGFHLLLKCQRQCFFTAENLYKNIAMHIANWQPYYIQTASDSSVITGGLEGPLGLAVIRRLYKPPPLVLAMVYICSTCKSVQ